MTRSASLREMRRDLDETSELLGLIDTDEVYDVASGLVETLQGGGRIYVAGCGGSMAHASHLAGELVGRFNSKWLYQSVICLSDPVIMTAIANDKDFKSVFSTQLAAHGNHSDAVVLFSTSGESPVVLEAARTASELDMFIVGLTGTEECSLYDLADFCVTVESDDTGRIQEIHQVIIHLLCGVVADLVFGHPR